MAVREIILLGDSRLYEVCQRLSPEDSALIEKTVTDLHDTLMAFREKYGLGRAIAAPQIGVMKRLIYMYTGSPTVFINPSITARSSQMMEVWDDCMSFPELFVRVRRHSRCRIEYTGRDWKESFMDLEGDLSELLQHEYDHLDGILAVARAIDGKSFCLRRQHNPLAGRMVEVT